MSGTQASAAPHKTGSTRGLTVLNITTEPHYHLPRTLEFYHLASLGSSVVGANSDKQISGLPEFRNSVNHATVQFRGAFHEKKQYRA